MNLVLLPGMDGTDHLFSRFIDAASPEFSLFPVSYPTHRKANYSELLDLILSQLPDEPFCLVGESFSGYPAYRAALTRPPGLIGVIFAASFLASPAPLWGKLTPLMPGRFLMKKPPPEWVIRKFLLGRNADETIIRQFKEVVQTVSPDVMWHRLKMIMALKQPTESLTVPVTYIRPIQDNLVPAGAFETIRRIAPDFTVFDVEGPHLILQTRPDQCLACIRSAVGQTHSVSDV